MLRTLLRSQRNPLLRHVGSASVLPGTASPPHPDAGAVTPFPATAESRMLRAFHERPFQHGLPGFFFSDADVFAKDMELIFHREWIFAGHTVELPKKGRYITLQVGAYPIVIVRGSDGALRAYHNICRHRGHKVCSEVRGKVGKRLVCPYHQWTYDFDTGKMVTARELTDTLDRSVFGLKQAHVEVASGHIFVSVAKEPVDFAPVRQMMERYGEPFGLEDTKVAHQTHTIEQGNWKLVWENNRECYHCSSAHPQLKLSFPASSSGSLPTDEERQFSEHAERLGLPSTFARSGDFQFRATRLPFVGGAQSMTMDGKPAVKGKRLGRMPEDNVGDLLFYHYPSTWVHWQADHALSFRVLPVSPTQTELVTTWLVPASAEEGVDYDFQKLTEVWEATNLQDKALVEGVQRGVSSPAFTPGPYSPVNEAGVIDFVDWYQALMMRRLGAA